jgi:hypothetical protein
MIILTVMVGIARILNVMHAIRSSGRPNISYFCPIALIAVTGCSHSDPQKALEVENRLQQVEQRLAVLQRKYLEHLDKSDAGTIGRKRAPFIILNNRDDGPKQWCDYDNDAGAYRCY